MINEKLIYDLFNDIAINPSHKGYEYVKTALSILECNPNISMGTLYDKIALKYDSTYSRVERCIRTEVCTCFDKGNINTLHVIFCHNIDAYSGKVTNSTFLKGLYSYIMLQSKEDTNNE